MLFASNGQEDDPLKKLKTWVTNKEEENTILVEEEETFTPAIIIAVMVLAGFIASNVFHG